MLREMAFLHGARARAWAQVLAAGLAAWVAVFVAARHGWLDRTGTVIAADFVTYWAAGKLALAGDAAAVYQVASISAVEHAALPLPPGAFTPFFYPPSYLLFCLPLALLPYGLALLSFSVVGAAAFLAVLRRLWPPNTSGAWLALLAYPALVVTLGSGQNGLFSAAFIGGYAVLLRSRPMLAGACLGWLMCKPQLAVAVPLLLLAARRPAPMFGAVGMVALLAAVSAALFGVGAWVAFVQALPHAGASVAYALMDRAKLISVMAGAQMLGLPALACALVQAVVFVVAAVCVARVGWRRAGGPAEAAMLAAACLLMTPYAADYDLPVMAVALVFCFGAGAAGGFLPWEKLILLVAYLLPLFAHGLAKATGVPLAPFVLMALLGVTARRGFAAAGAVRA